MLSLRSALAQPQRSRQSPHSPGLMGLLLTVSILSACSDSEETVPTITPTVPLPQVTITSFSPTTATVGDPLSFTLSAQFSASAGIPATDPVLITVTPPLGERTPITTFDVAQIPNCSVGSTNCVLNSVIVDASSQIPLTVTGSYTVTLSVLDLQGRVGQDTAVIQVGL